MPERGKTRREALGLVNVLLAAAFVGVVPLATANEAGLPDKDSTHPPWRDAGLEDQGTLLFDFNDLPSASEVPQGVYEYMGLLIGIGPFGSSGYVMTSSWSPDLMTEGPCDGSIALRTNPFVGPSIKFVIPEGTTSFAMDVGDYGPSDDDDLKVCGYADVEARDLVGCVVDRLPYGHDTQCLPMRLSSESRPILSIVVTSSSDQGPTPNSFFIDNLFIDGFCLEAEASPLYQDDPLWGSMPHAGTEGDLARYGAEVTALAMLLSEVGETQGFSITPGELETWLSGRRDGFLGAHVNPFALSRLATLSGLDLGYHGLTDRDQIGAGFLAALCRYGHPVAMTLDTAEGPAGDHVVLALAREEIAGETRWRIADPSGRATHLGTGVYPEAFLQHLDFHPGSAAEAFGIALQGADRVLVVDPGGRRSGFDESLGTELDDIPGLRHHWRALTDAQQTDAEEAWPMLYLERFSPEPGRYCVKPQADSAREVSADILGYDGLGIGSLVHVDLADGPATRPTIIVEVPDVIAAAPEVELFDNRAPVSSADAPAARECAFRGGAEVPLRVREWSDPDCDLVTHAWRGSFPEGGGKVHGEAVTVTISPGTHELTLVTDDGLLASDPFPVQVSVVDTVSPTGRITFPADRQCIVGPATIEDSFADVCDGELTRSYEPGPGPTYEAEGAHLVTLEVTDDSGNAARDQLAFIIDSTPPELQVIAPQMEQEVPRVEAIGRYLSSSDDDVAPGGVVAERILVDGCIVLDGAEYGDGDGLLHDEHFEVTGPLLCIAYRACGQTVFADSVFRVEAEDCAGNLTAASDVIEGTYTIDELDCD